MVILPLVAVGPGSFTGQWNTLPVMADFTIGSSFNHIK
jgi:hypothetical protein